MSKFGKKRAAEEVLRIKPDRSSSIYFLLGAAIGLIPSGLGMIGITVNIWLGAGILLSAFVLIVRAFWMWEKSAKWHRGIRAFTVITASLIYCFLIGRQIIKQYHQDHPPMAKSSPIPKQQESRQSQGQAQAKSIELSSPVLKKASQDVIDALVKEYKKEHPKRLRFPGHPYYLPEDATDWINQRLAARGYESINPQVRTVTIHPCPTLFDLADSKDADIHSIIVNSDCDNQVVNGKNSKNLVVHDFTFNNTNRTKK